MNEPHSPSEPAIAASATSVMPSLLLPCDTRRSAGAGAKPPALVAAGASALGGGLNAGAVKNDGAGVVVELSLGTAGLPAYGGTAPGNCFAGAGLPAYGGGGPENCRAGEGLPAYGGGGPEKVGAAPMNDDEPGAAASKNSPHASSSSLPPSGAGNTPDAATVAAPIMEPCAKSRSSVSPPGVGDPS